VVQHVQDVEVASLRLGFSGPRGGAIEPRPPGAR